ncbi:hypothetical protein EDD53_1114 [Pacificibacter maritimus]|uniref:Uncharacterized protein n=2 Tax=Pacificibacter maritimus TaxID=762213 RepID=A0A3N4UWR2_9RHOB|nr:hypothetical protein EDD53_1114 [Pacificibacter maritimus]
MAGLTLMRRLVTSLLVVMILGFLLLIGLLVTRFPTLNAPVSYDFPENITLPAGISAQNFTRGPDWVGIVTDKNAFLIFDATTGELRQTVEIQSATQ